MKENKRLLDKNLEKRKEGRNKEWTFRKFKRWQRVRKAKKGTDEFEMKRKRKKNVELKEGPQFITIKSIITL